MSNIHLNILIQLAKIDGVVVQEEIDLINDIGKAHGMTEEQISACFDEHHSVDDLEGLSDDEKFEYVYSIVQLMKIDGRLYDEEIKFCGKVAAKLGYNEEVLFELMLKIYSDPHISADKDEIKKRIQSHLLK
ncbi:MAG: TerB family tellurite resistance protein [Cyclobacteriaceae bacterium]